MLWTVHVTFVGSQCSSGYLMCACQLLVTKLPLLLTEVLFFLQEMSIYFESFLLRGFNRSFPRGQMLINYRAFLLELTMFIAIQKFNYLIFKFALLSSLQVDGCCHKTTQNIDLEGCFQLSFMDDDKFLLSLLSTIILQNYL